MHYLKGNPRASCIEVKNGVDLPFYEVCELLDEMLLEGKIVITAIRSTLDLYEVAV